MKLFSLLPKHLIHLACNSPASPIPGLVTVKQLGLQPAPHCASILWLSNAKARVAKWQTQGT